MGLKILEGPLALGKPGLQIYGDSDFDPISIAGLALWADFSAVPAGAIASHNDSSGNSRTLSQGTGSAQPTGVAAVAGFNNKNVARFDGADFLTTAAFELMGGGAVPPGFTIFAAASLTAVGSFPMCVTWQSSANELRGNSNTGKIEINAAATGSGAGTGSNLSGTGAHVLCGRFTDAGNASEVFVDGTSVVTAAPAGSLNNVAQVASIGARSAGSNFWTGDIAEVLIYNTDLSAGNRNAVKSYLAAKYNITVV